MRRLMVMALVGLLVHGCKLHHEKSSVKTADEIGSQNLNLNFKCSALGPGDQGDRSKTTLSATNAADGVNIVISNLISVCGARSFGAQAAFHPAAMELSLDLRQTGRSYCICSYTFDPFTVSVPDPVKPHIDSYRVSLNLNGSDYGLTSVGISSQPSPSAKP